MGSDAPMGDNSTKCTQYNIIIQPNYHIFVTLVKSEQVIHVSVKRM